MDKTIEEFALEPILIQNQENEILNKKKFNHHVWTRIFNSNKNLKQLIIWIILFICIIVIAGPVSLYITYRLPVVKSRNIKANIFSEERARDYLNNLTVYGSRVMNTRGNLDARDFLVSQIKRIYSTNSKHLRFEIDLQKFNNSENNQLENILVRISDPNKRPENLPSLLLTAHYDSVEFSSGSSDDGSGVVIVLELFSNVINDLSVSFSKINLIILFTNGEEMGPEGVLAFINQHSWRFNIHRFIYIDAITCNEKASLIQIESSQLIIDYSRVLRPSANVLLENIPKWIGTTGDYDIYSINGSLFGYNFGNFIDGYMYHTPNDQISLIKQGVFQELGENLGILTRNILQGNYEKIENNIDNDPLIYFDIFGRYLIVYKRSTSKIIQQILIVLSIIISIILILIDKIFHSQKLSRCVNCNCIYFYFKYSFILRILSILIYFLSNIISIILAFIFSISTALIISKTRPLSWYGNSTLTIFLFSFPCFIGFIVITYLTNIFHNFILKKWPKNGSRLKNNCIKMNFNIEQNFSIILIYIFLMLISIYFNNRIFYIILIWSIFICPMYLILNVIEYLIHQNLLKERFSYLFIPMLICLFPLIHTIEIMNRLVRIFIPFMTRDFSDGLSFGKNIFICNIILILSLFFILILIPILHRIKQFRRLLIILLFIFSILLIIIYNRQSFTRNHPKTFYAKHTSKSVYTGIKLKNLSFIVLLVSQLSSIRLSTYDNLPLSNVLDQFSAKSGYILHNKRCSMRPTICRFDDTFNRTFPIENIEIKSMNNLVNYTILIRHVLSYNIQISSRSSVKFIVQNQFIFPRTLTIIDIIINSTLTIFDIDIKIRRCDVNDSPFLLLFNRLMTNLILMGGGQCRAIDDDTNLIIDLNTLSK